MGIGTTNYGATSRNVWLRRSVPPVRNPSGAYNALKLSVLGNAAARETIVTATSHMAAIWTDLFQSMLTQGSELRWRDNGPGIGRDARIAFSGLLGRYVARAYLTEHEGVNVLVPLDVAKHRFQGTPYSIEKDPPGRGFEADWIGLDAQGLVIVEAKGTFDNGIKSWKGPSSRPQILESAIKQAERTTVYRRYPRHKLPAKRWAIASRWGTEENQREPTLLAWDSTVDRLSNADFRTISNILLRADADAVMRGLEYSESEYMLSETAQFERIPRPVRIRVGDHKLEPGFAALVGPFGILPLRSENDRFQIPLIPDLNLSFAVASFSSHYVMAVKQEEFWRYKEATRVPPEYGARQDRVIRGPAWYGREELAEKRFADQSGLTVVWPEAGEYIVPHEE